MLPASVSVALAGFDIDPATARSIAGGSINSTYRIASRSGTEFFLKLNTAGALDMFEAERDGLQALRNTRTVRVPEPLGAGVTEDAAWLLLEFIDLAGRRDRASAVFGSQLAALHRHTAESFGWHRDNTIGSTPQRNRWHGDWLEFWRDERLAIQLDLACKHGFARELRDRGDRLLAELPRLLGSQRPRPSLLHGDLWGGNWGVTRDGEPVIFDPAVYYGDRETDLAMTQLFGGFGQRFLKAYLAAWPPEPGFERRRDLYNLYHVLNHLNLFGGNYLAQAVEVTDRLLQI